MRTLARLLAAACAVLCMAAASDPAERLPDPAQEARARALFQEVRCLVCQNESIDDSDAELAADLRAIVRQEVDAGRSDADVRRFLTDRYGEYVLLKPQFTWANAALWFAPFLIVLGGAVLLVGRWRNRPVEGELSQAESDALARLARDDGQV
ncbi:cytochrome c-type biogenesis protein [Phenylobacterium sp.]|uniref:cytochrome c-type biogenesis protein n=1 Tax=Phenylobacterium sp. TaxID=1871053 RepID=UPI00272F2E88|nr:cytochrome c-type biogenesis protein [Phenylobacterium sp.]MDP1616072.1 cytochrome c-type biogenesis protein CcmH [Phenylobacterium sp.]MDP1986980.1 cytochrome c-type biogenesis protein CcmH [Phenylobacterium sp.]